MVVITNLSEHVESAKIYAAISADIVASTSLSPDEWKRLSNQVKNALDWIASKYSGFWGRLVKGDSIECILDNPQDALRIALMLKTLVKSFVPSDGVADGKFKRQGLRMAIGVGEMRIVDKENDVMDGKAIYLSGRTLSNMRSKPVNFFQIVFDKGRSYSLPIIVNMLDRRIDEATSRQCETLFYRLQYDRDVDVAKILGISRAGVNNNLRSIGWDLTERALAFYSGLVQRLLAQKRKEWRLEQKRKRASFGMESLRPLRIRIKVPSKQRKYEGYDVLSSEVPALV